MKKISFFASVLLVGLFMSCSNDDIIEEVVPQQIETSSANARASISWYNYPTWTIGYYGAVNKKFSVRSGKIVKLIFVNGSSSSTMTLTDNMTYDPLSAGPGQTVTKQFYATGTSLQLYVQKPLASAASVAVMYQSN